MLAGQFFLCPDERFRLKRLKSTQHRGTAVEEDAETTGILGGVDRGEAAWAATQGRRPGDRSPGRPGCPAVHPSSAPRRSSQSSVGLSSEDRGRAGTDSAQTLPQPGLAAGRVLPDAALYTGNDAEIYPL